MVPSKFPRSRIDAESLTHAVQLVLPDKIEEEDDEQSITEMMPEVASNVFASDETFE